jgi:hypothetical protein
MKITIDAAVVQQALDALEEAKTTDDGMQKWDRNSAAISALRAAIEQAAKCNPHPDAPHGFNRNASHTEGRYVCDCEGWSSDDEQAEGQEPVAEVAGRAGALHIKFLPAGSRLGLGDKLYSTTPAQPEKQQCAAVLPNGKTATNVYEAYAIGLSQGAQPALKPLTDEQTRSGFCQSEEQWTFRGMSAWQVWQEAKAWTEAAHGIKEQA